jgi:hypothetical protein
MKKALLTLVALATAGSAFAQGKINFYNAEIPNATGGGIYDAPIFRPGGTVGAGAGYTAGLFLASNLTTPLATTTFLTTPAQFTGIFSNPP